MAIKVGINGFGRIGRVVLRIMIEHPEQFDICGINLRKADLDYMVYMIKYDSARSEGSRVASSKLCPGQLANRFSMTFAIA